MTQGNRTEAQIHNQFSEILTREETGEEVTKPQVLLLCLSLSTDSSKGAPDDMLLSASPVSFFHDTTVVR
jgi:hypothetical protein